MSYALGIQSARYNKYEISRSQAPYEILIRLAKLANADLHYLITGENIRKPYSKKAFPHQINELIDWLPTPAAVYDRTKNLVAHNQLYLDAFFRDCPSIVRPGTPLEFIARAWANRRGLGPEEAEEYVQARLEFHTARRSSVQLTAGGTCLHLAETQHEDYRVVLFTEVTAFAETS
jgi:hypothetical protein